MTQLYDLMVLFDPNVPGERQQEISSDVERLIGDAGNVVTSQDWGTRRMAYEIDHRPEADYHLYQLEAEPGVLDRLRHSLKIMDGVLRFRIIKLKPGTPPPPPPRDGAVRREEREPSGRVAARAAADAPAESESGPESESESENGPVSEPESQPESA